MSIVGSTIVPNDSVLVGASVGNIVHHGLREVGRGVIIGIFGVGNTKTLVKILVLMTWVEPLTTTVLMTDSTSEETRPKPDGIVEEFPPGTENGAESSEQSLSGV